MYDILKHSHSGLRWLVLIALVFAIVKAFTNKSGQYTPSDKRTYSMAMGLCHVQLLLGLALYFISPMVQFGENTMKVAMTRFYTVEHFTMMLIALIIISVGFSKGRRKDTAAAAHKTTGIYYLIGLIIILAAIPWPFRALGAGWF